MILANFNRSSCYLFILIFLMTTGCTEKSANHLTVNHATSPVFQSMILQDTEVIQRAAGSQYMVFSQKTEIRQISSENEDQEIAENDEESEATSSAIATTAIARHTESLWTRMFTMYAIPESDNPRVAQELQNFLRHPKNLLALQRRAEPYLYHIIDELESKQMPGELALLPMIESAFRVNARSQAQASGLWQFTPATAVTFGLKKNWWYDGRRDVTASTAAATRYLKKLHKKFGGDWLLALASYNVGAGNVQKAIRKNTALGKDTSFWSLDLPRETKAYVPKLLAIAKIFSHAEQYNLPLQAIPNKPFFKSINISSQLDLSKAAELAGMPLNEFFNINPAFSHAITSPGGSTQILVKADNAETFEQKLADLPESDHVKWLEHKIKAGEDLNSIAKLHSISVETLIQINQLKDGKMVVGSILRLPPNTLIKA